MKYKFVLCFIVMIFCGTNVFAADYYNTVSCDGSYYYAIKTDGCLYRYGYYNYDSGEETENDGEKILDNAITVHHNYAVDESGVLWMWEDNVSEPVKIMESVKDVSVGAGHILMVKNDGSLWGMGSNSYGQLAQGSLVENEQSKYFKFEYEPSYINEPVQIMTDVKFALAGRQHSLVLKKDDSLWSFGNNSRGQCGNGTDEKLNNVPVKIADGVADIFAGAESGFVIFKNDNTVLWRWGTNRAGYIGVPDDIEKAPAKYVTDVKGIASFSEYNLFIKSDNSLWYSGCGNEKQEYKIADNVNSVAGVSEVMSKILVLDNMGDLNVYEQKAGGEILFEKLLSKRVRLNGKIPSEYSFVDLNDTGNEVVTAVKALSKAGIITGVSDTEYGPGKEITRAEATALLLRLIGRANIEGSARFVDVTSDMWYYDIAEAGVEEGIINGFEDGTFRGEEKVTGMQFATMVSRVLEKETFEEITNKITLNELPEWSKTAIEIAVSTGVIKESELSITEQTTVDRGTAALILYRLYNKI